MSQKIYDRRTVLKTIPAATVACALLPACGNGATAQGTVNVVGGMASVPFAQYPALQNPGGGVLLNTSTGVQIVVVRTGATTATALNAVCTHEGCLVDYVQSSNDLECPCHGSKYSITGQVTQGPARQALTTYTATVGTDAITVAVG